MSELSDYEISTARIVTKSIAALEKSKKAKIKKLYLPSCPAATIKKAQESATSTGVALLLAIGLMTKLERRSTVKVTSKILKAVGLSRGQVRRAASGLVDAGLVEVISEPGKRREFRLLDRAFLARLGMASIQQQ